MTNDLLVRPVTRQDYDLWLPLWDGYNAFYGRSGPTALAADITRTTWERFFDAYEPVNALVAESGGQLLGLTHYI
ncbi:GNAT family N-acetyltransferase, partial [Escherichia coli]|nr:GNAT family N-acetyltransferase [Escherichia coli]